MIFLIETVAGNVVGVNTDALVDIRKSDLVEIGKSGTEEGNTLVRYYHPSYELIEGFGECEMGVTVLSEYTAEPVENLAVRINFLLSSENKRDVFEHTFPKSLKDKQ